MKWQTIDNQNIADIMIEVYGKNEADLFGNILEAFTDIITKVNKIKEKKEIAIKITGKNLPDLIINFINQLIYLKDTALMVFKNGKFKFTFTEDGYSLYSVLSGQEIAKNLPIRIDIKALALHKFKVQKIHNKYKVSLVFDI
ncbi:archease [Candidatus Roizmanbacteria bacterium]|nr:archease [Candidatus Roizmanbacteria bacterium]